MKNRKTITMWVLSVFMALVSLAYFPSITSALAILFVVIALPVKPLQEFLTSNGLRGWIKAVVLCAVFLGAIMVTPNRGTMERPPAQPSYYGALPSKKPEQETVSGSEALLEETVVPTQVLEELPTSAPVVVSTPSPSPSSTPSPVPSPTPSPSPKQPSTGGNSSSSGGSNSISDSGGNSSSGSGSGNSNSSGGSGITNEITGNLGRTAYWTPGGRSYHFSSNCRSLSRSRNIRQGTLQNALNAGKTDPCNNCAGGH